MCWVTDLTMLGEPRRTKCILLQNPTFPPWICCSPRVLSTNLARCSSASSVLAKVCRIVSFSLVDGSPYFCRRSVLANSSCCLTWSMVLSRRLLCSPTKMTSKAFSLILVDVASAPDIADRAVVAPPSKGMPGSNFERVMIRRQKVFGVGPSEMAVFDV
jgi:hypothetical protein